MTGSIVWPEGQPERAVYCEGRLARWWKMYGPMGWGASFRGRRMARMWPASPKQQPVVMARQCERFVRRQS